MKCDKRWVNFVLLFGLWLIWGYSWIIVKNGLPYIGPFRMGFLFPLIGALTLLPVLVATGRSLKPTPFWPSFLLGMTQTAGYTVLALSALLAGGVGKVSVLSYTMPFWTLLLARMVLNERLQPRQWLAVSLALFGLALLLEPWSFDASPWPTLLALGSGLIWAVSAVIARRWTRDASIDPVALTFWQLLWGMVPLGLLAWWIPAPETVWNTALIAALLYNGVLCFGLGCAVWLMLLSRLSAGVVGLNVLAVPVFSVLFAWLQLNEVPRDVEAAGMLLIIVALLVLAQHSWQSDRAGRPA